MIYGNNLVFVLEKICYIIQFIKWFINRLVYKLFRMKGDVVMCWIIFD